ncbi:MAG: DNA replication/repair protein RecF [Oscillospiraceae bacterium]|nr:DNA replication/repair protein RecF [Oscillospiraceae bacterium]
MVVKKLHLIDFRNYKEEKLEFDDGINVIVGSNAQGKTSLIEAIYYLASARSFRLASDKEMISLGHDASVIKIDMISGGRNQTLEARFFRGRRREIYINGAKLKALSELAGKLTAVPFSPDDLGMVKDSAVVRRKMMDQCLSQLRPGYLAAITEFNRLYNHKSRILRDYREKPSLLELLDDYNLRMAHQSARIIYYRSSFVNALSNKAADIHQGFSDGEDVLEIRYKTVGGMQTFGKKPEQLLPDLLEHQREHRNAELQSGLCLSGIHKDDLEIDINGVAARKFASQGQARTVVISIKLAERDMHFNNSGEYPLLLLDDVLSELDAKRQNFVLEKINNGQVFITCCDERAARVSPNSRIIHIKNGSVI